MASASPLAAPLGRSMASTLQTYPLGTGVFDLLVTLDGKHLATLDSKLVGATR